jgi:hypothetical protein
VDEKSQIQTLDRTQPGLPMKKGRCGTMTHDYKRHGTTTLFAALNILEGTVIAWRVIAIKSSCCFCVGWIESSLHIWICISSSITTVLTSIPTSLSGYPNDRAFICTSFLLARPAQLDRALVRQIDRQADPTRHFPQRARTDSGDQKLRQREQQRSCPLRLDRFSSVHHQSL